MQSHPLEPTSTIDRLIGLLQSEASNGEIVSQIEECSELASALLSQVNSVAFALPHQIRRVDHALTMLGRRRVVEAIKRTHRDDSTHSPPFAKASASSSAETRDQGGSAFRREARDLRREA